MRIEFWGVRGSIVTPQQAQARYGGNTPCVLAEGSDGTMVVFDAGLGLRWLATHLLGRFVKGQITLELLLSHTHWDHIQGIPFAPIMYIPGNVVNIYGFGGPTADLRETLLGQMKPDFCPVPNFFLRDDIGARVVMTQVEPSTFGLSGATVTCRELPGGSGTVVAGYRVEMDGKSLAYLTDVEYPDGPKSCPAALELARGVDLLIHDGQLLPEEREKRRNWGHSTYKEAAELAGLASAKRLAIIHHDPCRSDDDLDEMARQLRQEAFDAFPAAEGQVISL